MHGVFTNVFSMSQVHDFGVEHPKQERPLKVHAACDHQQYSYYIPPKEGPGMQTVNYQKAIGVHNSKNVAVCILHSIESFHLKITKQKKPNPNSL